MIECKHDLGSNREAYYRGCPLCKDIELEAERMRVRELTEALEWLGEEEVTLVKHHNDLYRVLLEVPYGALPCIGQGSTPLEAIQSAMKSQPPKAE